MSIDTSVVEVRYADNVICAERLFDARRAEHQGRSWRTVLRNVPMVTRYRGGRVRRTGECDRIAERVLHQRRYETVERLRREELRRRIALWS